MIWTTKKINDIFNKIFNLQVDLKSILRDITIDDLLSEKSDSDSIKFPFFIKDGDMINPLLKASEIPFKCTEKEISNINNSKKIEFLSNLVKVPSPVLDQAPWNKRTGTIGYNFIINNYQRRWMKEYENNDRNIFITSNRQMGSSTLLSFCALHHIINNSNQLVCMISKSDIFSKFLGLYENTPYYLKVGIEDITYSSHRSPNTHRIKFENGCVIDFGTTPSFFIGKSANFVLSEVGIIPELFSSIQADSKAIFFCRSVPIDIPGFKITLL